MRSTGRPTVGTRTSDRLIVDEGRATDGGPRGVRDRVVPSAARPPARPRRARRRPHPGRLPLGRHRIHRPTRRPRRPAPTPRHRTAARRRVRPAGRRGARRPGVPPPGAHRQPRRGPPVHLHRPSRPELRIATRSCRGIAPETCSLEYRYWSLDVDDPANVPAGQADRPAPTHGAQPSTPAGVAVGRGPTGLLPGRDHPEGQRGRRRARGPAHRRRPRDLRWRGRARDPGRGAARRGTHRAGRAADRRRGPCPRHATRSPSAHADGRRRRSPRAWAPSSPSGWACSSRRSGRSATSRELRHTARSRRRRSIVLVTVLGAGARAARVGIARRSPSSRRDAGSTTRRAPAGLRVDWRGSAPPRGRRRRRAAFARGRSRCCRRRPPWRSRPWPRRWCSAPTSPRSSATPHRYGWPWQVGVLTGFGYGETDRGLVAATLARPTRGDVLGRARLRERHRRPGPGRGALRRALAGPRGRARAGSRAGSAKRRSVGPRPTDSASTSGTASGSTCAAGRRRVRVVGTTVMPAIGQYQSDRSGLGVGAFTVLPKARMDDHAVTFIGVHLRPAPTRPGPSPPIRPQVVRWDATGAPPYTYVTAVRPAEIVNADATQGAPMVLAGVLALALLTALGAVARRDGQRPPARLRGAADDRLHRRDRSRGASAGTRSPRSAPASCSASRSASWRPLAVGRFAEEIGVGPDPTFAGAATLSVGGRPAAAAVRPRAVHAHPAEILHTAERCAPRDR